MKKKLIPMGICLGLWAGTMLACTAFCAGRCFISELISSKEIVIAQDDRIFYLFGSYLFLWLPLFFGYSFIAPRMAAKLTDTKKLYPNITLVTNSISCLIWVIVLLVDLFTKTGGWDPAGSWINIGILFWGAVYLFSTVPLVPILYAVSLNQSKRLYNKLRPEELSAPKNAQDYALPQYIVADTTNAQGYTTPQYIIADTTTSNNERMFQND